MHIARLADLNLKEDEIEKYRANLADILNFANIVNNAPIDGLVETIGANDAVNVFRKDEVVDCGCSKEELLQNAPDEQEGMFKIPKVIN